MVLANLATHEANPFARLQHIKRSMQVSKERMSRMTQLEIIEYVSTWTTLVPGDVLVTGTPGGVGARRNPLVWMKPGDKVEIEIDKVGVLENPIAAEE